VVFAVPAGVSGCSVPVAIVINGIASNTAFISVSADGSTCSDPLGTSSSDLQTGTNNGAIRTASFTLSHTDGGNPPDTGSGAFTSTPFAKYAASLTGPPTAGSCQVVSGGGNASLPTTGAVALDGGAALQLTGPAGAVQLPKLANGGYGAVISPILSGSYSLTGAGGGDVGAFMATLPVPTPLTWTNRTALTSITPGNSFAVNWTAGDPNGYVAIEGVSASSTLFAIFVCVEKASAGTFTVPGYITAAMPVGTGGVDVSQTGSPVRFAAPGIDAGYFSYTVGSVAGPFAIGSAGGGKK
jgi:hypothetical protein